MNDIACQQEEKEHNETGAVFRKVNQIVAQPYFNHHRRNLPDQGGLQMFPACEFGENGNGGEKNVGGIGDSPGKGHVFHAAVFIKLGEHMLLLNNAAGFLAEENTADVEADFDADDFACPGNQNSRQQTKEGTHSLSEREWWEYRKHCRR